MFGKKRNLIVVYKDELILNQLRKLVESNDDQEDAVVGIEDGSVSIVAWSEKVWRDQKKAGVIADKVLFLGNCKSSEELLPIVDLVFEDNGVKFGWAGKQAVLSYDVRALDDSEIYARFLDELKEMGAPNLLLPSKVDKEKEQHAGATSGELMVVEEQSRSTPKAVFSSALNSLRHGMDVAQKVGVQAITLAEDALTGRAQKERQMAFYGVVRLYREGLADFMEQ